MEGIGIKDMIGFADMLGEVGRKINSLLLEIHPMDLLPALVEMTEGEKQRLLDYYQSKESYLHCDVVYKMMDAYNNDPVHKEDEANPSPA